MGACLSFPLLRTARAARAVRASTVTYTRVPDDGDSDSDVLIFPVRTTSVGTTGLRARHV
jgi:hypothetical protein